MTVLLGVWAHPDDEAYCSSGLMGQVRDEGGRVVVVTATRGERGTADPDAWPPAQLGALREEELRRSLGAVGVTEHRWLGLEDGDLDEIDADSGAARLMPILDEVRPTVVVTFGPDGMTGHPDHKAVSAWATRAWQLSGQWAALWYATLTPEFHRAWGRLNDEVGLWMDGSAPPVTEASHLAAEVRLLGPELDRKHRALRAHASQTRPLEQLVGPDRYRAWWSIESFVAAKPGLSTESSA